MPFAMAGFGVAASLTPTRDQTSLGFDDQVHFRARRGTPKVEPGVHTSMCQGSVHFTDHRSIEDGPAHGAGHGIQGVTEAGESAQGRG